MRFGADDGHAARRNGADDRLVTEDGEIVGRAAPAPDDDDVDLAHPLQQGKGAANRLSRPGALNLRGRKQDASAAAPKRDAAYVVDDCARRARHHPHDPRLLRKGALAPGRK